VAWAEAYTPVPSGILIHQAVWSQQTVGEMGCSAPFRESYLAYLKGYLLKLGPHLTQYDVTPGPRPTSIPSGILIYPAVWPEYTWAKSGAPVSLLGGGELGPMI